MKKRLLNKLAKAVNKATEGYYGTPKVFGPGDGWGEGLTFAWDGPFDWTMITAGSSVYAGDLNDYSMPVEKEIGAVLDEIESAGYYLEPINNVHLGIYSA
jgi:hypothetical protein